MIRSRTSLAVVAIVTAARAETRAPALPNPASRKNPDRGGRSPGPVVSWCRMAPEPLPTARPAESPIAESPDAEVPDAADRPMADDAAARFVRRHQRAVLGYLGSLGCPPELVEDLAQDTFVAALRTGLVERDEVATRAWLRTVARTHFLDHLRRTRRSASIDLDAVDAAWRRFEGDDGGGAYQEALRACLEGLEPRERRALELRYGEGRDRAGVAAAVGLSLGGLKALVARALARLRTCIERRLT